MAVYKNTRGVWQFVVWVTNVDGIKKQVKRENKNWIKKDAQIAEREFLKNFSRVTSDLTFLTLVERFIESKKTRLKKRSILTYNDQIKTHIFPYFKNQKINTILKSDIRRWQKILQDKKLSNSYTLSIQSLLKEIFLWAEKNDFIEKSPFVHDRVHIMKTHREISFLTHEEYIKFSECIDDFEYEIIFDVLYWCGVRKGELMALRFSDVDLYNQSIHISKNFDTRNHITTTPKNNTSYREIILVSSLVKKLEVYIENCRRIAGFNSDLYLFGFDSPISSTTLERKKNNYCRLSGIHQIRIHDFRHSHVSLLISQGESDFSIAKRLGHSRDMVNNRYGHWFRHDQIKMVNSLNNLILHHESDEINKQQNRFKN